MCAIFFFICAGAIRRLQQHSPVHHRPVHRVGPEQVDPAEWAGDAAAPRHGGHGGYTLRNKSRSIMLITLRQAHYTVTERPEPRTLPCQGELPPQPA